MIRIRRVEADNFKLLRNVRLDLPPRGRFLVHGLNESGKSTLFEAVFFGLFGRPLVSESSRGVIDDIIAYGADEARVLLELEFDDGRRLVVGREARRGRANVWTLDVIRRGVEVEQIAGNQAVNERLRAELGLDADALLNTCFVEQKKLDKLEGMTRAQRESSLMKLLNLDRLVALEEDLKVRTSDEEELRRARARTELALQADRLPRLLRAHRVAEAGLLRHALCEAFEQREAQRRVVERLLAEHADAASAEAKASATARHLQVLEEIAVEVGAAAALASRSLELAKAVERGTAELEAMVSDRDQRAPQVLRRRRSLERVRDRLARRECWGKLAERVEARGHLLQAELEELGRDRERLHDIRRRLMEARATLHDDSRHVETLEGDLRAFEVRDAVAELIGALASGTEATDDLARAEARRAGTRRRFLGALTLATAAGLGLLGTYAGGANGPLQWLGSQSVPATGDSGWPGLAAPLAVIALIALIASLVAAGVLGRRLVEQGRGVMRLEGELAAFNRDRDQRRSRAIDRLQALNSVAPSTPERASAVLAELDQRLDDRSRPDVAQALEQTRQTVADANAQAGQLADTEAELRAKLLSRDVEAIAHELELVRAGRDKAKRLHARWQSRLTADASGGLPVESGPLERAFGEATEELRSLRQQAARIPGTQTDLANARSELADTLIRAADRAEAARSALAKLTDVGSDNGASTAVPRDLASGLGSVKRALEATGDDWPAPDMYSGRAAESRATAPETDSSTIGDSYTSLADWSYDLAAASQSLSSVVARLKGDVGESLAGREAAAAETRLEEAKRALDALEERLQAAQEAAQRAEDELASLEPEREGRANRVDSGRARSGEAQLFLGPIFDELGREAQGEADPEHHRLVSVSETLRRELIGSARNDAEGAEDPHADSGPPAPPGLSRTELEDHKHALEERLNVVRHEIRRLEDELGVAATEVDASEAVERLNELTRSIEVRRRAARIVGEAARNVMQNVLPSTLDYMRLLLPALTAERYFDARLTDDYNIEVWDDRAGDWRKKNIFSGGTKDQFSLALRLAFALATLPEERGTAPSFLFLDEPLGGFDRERADALVELLTDGAVSRAFDQIFLVSHVPVESSRFDYRIVLGDGELLESDF